MELVRTTEYAALACARWIGRGDKEGADGAAVDAMRILLDTVAMDGVVVIGEGEKDEAPMLYNGEQIGDGSPPQVDIAVDPLEGTELCAKGLPNAIATIALSERGTMFDPGPCVYMMKMATSRDLAHLLDLDRPLRRDARLMAKEKGVAVGDLVVIMLDRPRHEDAMKEIREVGARIRLIPHGDVSAALVAVTEGSPVDLLYGIGGTPEGVLAAAAIKCTGGQILGRLWPRSDEERNAALEAGYDLDEVLDRDRLVSGNDVFFAATGVTDGEMLDGVHYIGPQGADHGVDLDALALGDGAPDQRSPRPGEAAGDRWGAPGVSAPGDRGLQVQVRQRAQERVGHDHVDAQLGLVVEEAAEPRAAIIG